MSTDIIAVQEVKTKKDLKAFLHFPWRIYRGDPNWVPPLLKEYEFHFSLRNPFLHHAQIVPYVAIKDGSIKGRIAAIIDRNYIDFHHEEAGFFGFFESVNDPSVTHVLLDQVKGFLRNRDLKTVMGPVNPSTNDECGLLIEGFDTSPCFMMPYNPPYYRELLEGCGLQKAKDLYANFMADEEMNLMVKKMKPLVVPDLALFAEIGDETVGFALALPDYNFVLKRLNG